MRWLLASFVICLFELLSTAVKAQQCSPSDCLWAGSCYGKGAIVRQGDNLLHFCDKGEWLIDAPEPQHIALDSAIYGCRCGNQINVTAQAVQICNSDTAPTASGGSCSVPASNASFGDPGKNQSPKVLIIKWHCEQKGVSILGSEQQAEAREGSNVVLACPK
jgi:hypothetical protein